MTVTYFLRSPGTGHSLEQLTESLRRATSKQVGTMVVQMPCISRNLRAIWFNGRYVIRYLAGQAPGAVMHITGDIHYVALVLPASRTILTIHDCSTLERCNWRSVRYMFFWLFWFYLPMRRVRIVTTISETTRQELRRYMGRLADKVRVVPNGYDSIFSPDPQPFNESKPTLLHVGTAPNKNLGNLLTAIRGLPCRLLIVGQLSPADLDKLNRLQIEYENQVDVSREQMATLYKRCDMVTFVSLYEGFGMPILEGQATGRPVLTSRQRPMTDVAGADGACFVDPADPQSIREGVLRIWHDKAFRDECIRAGQRNARQYTMARMADQYQALYKEIGSTGPLTPVNINLKILSNATD